MIQRFYIGMKITVSQFPKKTMRQAERIERKEEICGAALLLLKFSCRDLVAPGPATLTLAGGRPRDVTT